MSIAAWIILINWFILPAQALYFLLLYGWPRRYRDSGFGWHLFAATAVAGVQPVVFLLARFAGFWPAAIVETAANALMTWRIAMAIRARPKGDPMASVPTQVAHPRRATLRTAAAIVGATVVALPLLPVVAQALHVEAAPLVVMILGGSAAITRVLAIPGVEDWLRRYAPWLAAQPATAGQGGEQNAPSTE